MTSHSNHGSSDIEGPCDAPSIPGSALLAMLSADQIAPGADPSYQLCKTIYLYHPLGAKLVEKPLEIAQSQTREISIPKGPEDRLKEAFEAEWQELSADSHIFNLAALSRTYGISSIAVQEDGVETSEPLDLKKLADADLSFNAFDPLNTAGSLVLNQTPTDMDFQHVTEIRVSGKTYHKSRTCVLMNERPVYISYTSSAFGFVGRSVYQRSLFPLKTYLQTLFTDDMVVRKAGVLVAKLKPQGSMVNNLMQRFLGLKRGAIKRAETYNVLSIGDTENIESLNFQNLEGPYSLARKNVLENIAAAAGQPSILVTQETFAEGFGEGTEDAKEVLRFIDRIRQWLRPPYDYFDRICQRRAWNEDFYRGIQEDYPEYRNVPYESAFYRWVNSFKATWPSLMKEPDSEKIKVDDVKLKAIIAVVEVLLPAMDPENRARVIEWLADNFNSLKLLFDSPLELDYEAIADYEPPSTSGVGDGMEEPHEPKPFAAQDSTVSYEGAVLRLMEKAAQIKKQKKV